jgi:hypothetical protein
MPQILSGQVFRQWAPRRLLRFGLDYRGDCRRCRCPPLRLVGLQRLKRQFELLVSRASFSEERPNSVRRYRANWNFSRAISAWAVSASCAIAAMMRFSAAASSGRLSGVIGTPAVDQTCSP